jgi:hypothetical protein
MVVPNCFQTAFMRPVEAAAGMEMQSSSFGDAPAAAAP